MLFMQNIFATCWIYVGSARVLVYRFSQGLVRVPVIRFSQGPARVSVFRFSQGPARVPVFRFSQGHAGVPVFRFLQGPGSRFSSMPKFKYYYFLRKLVLLKEFFLKLLCMVKSPLKVYQHLKNVIQKHLKDLTTLCEGFSRS